MATSDDPARVRHDSNLKIGLTGGIASGKSTVARYFSALGACVVDADLISHEVMEPGGGAFQPVVDRFGPEILDGQGTIVRSRLAELVFSDPDAEARFFYQYTRTVRCVHATR